MASEYIELGWISKETVVAYFKEKCRHLIGKLKKNRNLGYDVSLLEKNRMQFLRNMRMKSADVAWGKNISLLKKFGCFLAVRDNKLFHTIMLLPCIRLVSGSNLGRDAGCPDCGFSWFSSVLLGKFRDSILSKPPSLHPRLFTSHHQAVISPFFAI
jgi:hypothetical protein